MTHTKFSQVGMVGSPQPKSWAEYRKGCLDTYGGGHHDDGHLEAFRHGMETVFNLLEAEFPPAEECKASAEMAEALKEAIINLRHLGNAGLWTQPSTREARQLYLDTVAQFERILREAGAIE